MIKFLYLGREERCGDVIVIDSKKIFFVRVILNNI